MRLSKLSFRGVTRFTAEEPVSVDFDGIGGGLVACVGANGAGKTTLLEAAIAALYREFPSRPNWYENFSGRDALIEATFFDLESADEITVRTLVDAEQRKTEQFVFVNGTSVTTGRAKEAEAEIEKRFGSLSLLLASVFASQDKSGNFLLLAKRDRKALMVELLGLSYLETLHESAKTHRVFADSELVGVRAKADAVASELGELPALEEHAAEAERSVKQLLENVDALRATEAEASTELDRIRVADAQVVALRERVEGAQREVDTAQAELLDVEQLPASIRAQAKRETDALAAKDPDTRERKARERQAKTYDELDATKAELVATAARVADIDAAAEKISALEAEASELEVAEANEAELRNDVELARINHEHAKRSFAAANGAQEAERSRLERQHDLLAKVPCTEFQEWSPVGDLRTFSVLSDTCPLLADARDAGESLEKLAPVDRTAVAETLSRLDDAEANLEAAALKCDPVRLEEIATRLVGLHQLAAQRPLVDKAAEELEKLPARYKAADDELEHELKEAGDDRHWVWNRQAEIEANAASALKEAAEKRAAAEERVAAARGRLDVAQSFLRAAEDVDLAAAETRLAQVAEHRKAAEAELRGAENELAGITGQLEQLRAKEASLKTLRSSMSIAEEAVGDWGLLAQALGRDGIQALEIDAAGPEVARLTNELLEACYGSRFSIGFETLREKKSARGEYSEVFDIRVFDRGHERAVEALSGGERVVVGEAIGLAISVFNARKSGIRWRTLFRDETAGALDEDNATAYTEMLRRALALGGFDQVLFVSHSPLVWERADVQLLVADGLVSTSAEALEKPAAEQAEAS